MNKVTAAVLTGITGLVAVFFGRANGLITDAMVMSTLVGTGYATLAILTSWAVTAVAGSNHATWARVVAGTLCLAGGWTHWHAISVGWLAVTGLVMLLSPILFMGLEAVLRRYGVRLRKDTKSGAVIGVGLEGDVTVMLGAQVDPTVPRDAPAATAPKP